MADLDASNLGATARQAVMDDEIDLARLWGLLVDHGRVIALVTVLAILVGVGYLFIVNPVYRADALLQVEKRETGIAALSSDMADMLGKADSTDAEIEIVRSRMVLGPVVNELQLDLLVEPVPLSFQRFWSQLGHPDRLAEMFRGIRPAQNAVLAGGWGEPGRTVRIEQFTVPDHLRGEEWTLQVAAPDRVELFLDDELVLQGPPGETLHSADHSVALHLLQMDAPPGSAFRLVRYSQWAALEQLEQAFSVSQRGRDTGVLFLTLEGNHAERVKEILSAIARTYLLQNIERRSAEAAKSLVFLNQQLPKIRTELDTAEQKLNSYRTKSESVDLSLETEAVLKQQVELETRLSDLQFKESELRRLYTPQHPTYRALLQQRASLEQNRKRLDRQVQELPQTQQEILRLVRDVETNQAIYVQLLNKSQELEILKAGTVGNVRIIDNAQVAPQPVKPRAGLVLALSALLGMVTGVAGVFIAVAMKQTIESPEQLEEEGIPVYAALPRSTSQEQLERQGALRKRKGLDKMERKPLLAYSHPGDVTVEALRSLRTSLHFAMLGAGNKVVMITGPSPGVGKSFVTVNLGVVLAQAGKKVVIVDGDLRKGHLHAYFGATPQNGLSNYLAGGQIAGQGLVRRTSVSGLDFIPRGEVPPNPSELLLQPRLKILLQKLSEKYDYILVDSPPVLAVTDAAIIGEAAGATLLVVRFGVNTLREMNLCRRRLERNGVAVKGCIFNALERRASNTYGYYAYYSYKYGDGRRERPGAGREVIAQADAAVGLESTADAAEKI